MVRRGTRRKLRRGQGSCGERAGLCYLLIYFITARIREGNVFTGIWVSLGPWSSLGRGVPPGQPHGGGGGTPGQAFSQGGGTPRQDLGRLLFSYSRYFT